jgi:hypothetical protein
MSAARHPVPNSASAPLPEIAAPTVARQRSPISALAAPHGIVPAPDAAHIAPPAPAIPASSIGPSIPSLPDSPHASPTMPLNASTRFRWFQTSAAPALAAGDLRLPPLPPASSYARRCQPLSVSLPYSAPGARMGTERWTLSMKCTLPCWRCRGQALPHTDFCFSAFPVKQLVGLNRSHDVSTSRAPPSLASLATVSPRLCARSTFRARIPLG